MKKIIFDFDRIGTLADFYKNAKQQFDFPDYFGNNLDALWDCITGDVTLPVEISFINLKPSQLEQFDDIINLFEEAQGEMSEDEFVFNYFLKKDY